MLLAHLVERFAFAIGPQTVLAQEAAQSPETRTRTFVDLMAGSQYAQASELFTRTIRRSPQCR